MGADKAWLRYQDRPQWQVVYQLLETVCERVFVSVRPEQQQPEGVEILPDTDPKGPAGGLISAIRRNSDAAWLVVAVDMPRVTEAVLLRLVSERAGALAATAFVAEDGLPEPLLAIFEPSGFSLLLDFYNQNQLSLRKFLLNTEVRLLTPAASGELMSVDTPAQFRQITGK